MKNKNTIVILIALVIWAPSCKKDDSETPGINRTEFYIPKGWPQPTYTFTNNSISPSGFLLGKKLFFDPILSRDSSISCSSCHLQHFAFSDSSKQFSVGIGGAIGTRNSPPLFNLAWNNFFMWDGGVNHLEIQPFAPINNPIEMDENLMNVVLKLNSSSSYKNMFLSAFGTDSITSQLLFKAMAQFMGRMISDNSKYDMVKRGQGYFTPSEQSGYTTFKAKCNTCHTEPLFSDQGFRNNGLPIDPVLKDYGRFKATSIPSDSFIFKTPSLRNIELTAPYMHDGRFTTLNEVLDHYENGIYPYSNLDPLLTEGIGLTFIEKQNIIAFLKTLTDYTYINQTLYKY